MRRWMTLSVRSELRHTVHACQVRVAAVRAIKALVPCGAADALLTLTAFQDPHYVPVRAFYGPCVRVNFCARLVVDASVQARRACVSAGNAMPDWLNIRASVTRPSPLTVSIQLRRVLGAQHTLQRTTLLQRACAVCPLQSRAAPRTVCRGRAKGNRSLAENLPKPDHFGAGQVRREFLDALAQWLLGLPQREEHRLRLLPYLLAALADPVPDLAAAAAAHLGALGAQYEREHASELKACCLAAAAQQPPAACLSPYLCCCTVPFAGLS